MNKITGLFHLSILLVVFASCGEKTTEPEPEPIPLPVNIEEVTGTIDLEEIGINSIAIYSAWDDPQIISESGEYTIKVSSNAPQVLIALDDTLGLRALSLNIPQGESVNTEYTEHEKLRNYAVSSNIGALSTVKALIGLSPGFYTDRPTNMISRFILIMENDDFWSAVNYLIENLPSRPLYDIIQDQIFTDYVSGALQTWWEQENTNPPDFFDTEELDDSDLSNVEVDLVNRAYRYLGVYRRVVGENDQVLSSEPVATGLDCMESSVPVSWGSIFTFTMGDDAHRYDYVNMENPLGIKRVEYWGVGPGYKIGGPQLPPEIEPSLFWPYGRSVYEFIVGPFISVVLGLKSDTWGNWNERIEIFEKLYETPSVVLKVRALQESEPGVDLARDLVDALIGFIQPVVTYAGTLAGSTTLGSALAASGKILGAATAGLSLSNMIIAASYWEIMTPVAFSDVYHPIIGYVTITSPNGGENWEVGSTQQITWDAFCLGLKIEYSYDGGSTWHEIDNHVDYHDQPYDWIIPDTPTNQALVRLTENREHHAACDTSDGYFTIQSQEDIIPPAAIYYLSASDQTVSSITLTWFAPGDDDHQGKAMTYDIRFSTSSINASNWESATKCIGEPEPQVAGSIESFVVDGLESATIYYFAIKTMDDNSNWSPMSYVAIGCTSAFIGSWAALGSGMDNSIKALAVYNGRLVAAGYFTVAGGTAANRIAAWDGSNWESLGTGTNGPIHALTIFDGKLIAGGYFTEAGSVDARGIAAWDGTSWSQLGGGLYGSIYEGVYSLCVYNGSLIAGGNFKYRPGNNTVNGIASWDGIKWSNLGTGMSWPYNIYDVIAYDEQLVAVGNFDKAGGVNAKNVAAWNGITWSPIISGTISSDVNVAMAATIYEGNLIVGGGFAGIGGIAADNIAAWNGSSWSTVGSGFGYETVRSLTIYDDMLVAGGMLDITGDGIWIYGISVWNGILWMPLVSGMSDEGSRPIIKALTVYNGQLVAAGSFTDCKDIVLNNIAIWQK